MMLAALALVSAAGCVSGPSPRAIVKTELDSAFAYPGMRAFPGLYEIVSIDIVRKHSVNPNTYDVEADVKVRLLKDLSKQACEGSPPQEKLRKNQRKTKTN